MSAAPRTVEYVLQHYLAKEDVEELCDDLGLPLGGDKDALIARLLGEPEFDPDDTLPYLDGEQLLELCGEWDLDVSGSRDHLLDLVSEAMAPATPPTPDTGPLVQLPVPLVQPPPTTSQPPPPSDSSV